jgi:hypothetical protein
MDRRTFFLTTGGMTVAGGLAGAAAVKAWNATRAELDPTPADAAADELSADVVIIGGSLGGCAAALGALREGATVILAEETDWVGGQLTTQCVPPDENQYIETGEGANAEYLRLRTRVRDAYRTRTNPALTKAAKGNPRLNPGNSWVSRLTAEPRVWLAELEAMLEPGVQSGKLTVLREWSPVSAAVERDAVKAVTGLTKDGRRQTLVGKYFLDATENGNLLPMTKTEFVTGSESQKETGEPSAGPVARPDNVQSFTWVFALDHKPAEYEFWRSYKPAYAQNPQLSWVYPAPGPDGKPKLGFDPTQEKAEYGANLWTYRRALDTRIFDKPGDLTDISLINWGQNDYHRGPIVAVTPEEATKNLAAAKSQSMSLLYWLQTEAPRPDGKVGWPGLRLRPDVTGTVDGIAKRPYIRESRRIKAEFTVLEQHVSKPIRTAAHKGPGIPRAVQFPDAVGIGLYLYIDIHATSGGDSGGGVGVLPFQIPMGALIPKRVDNLLAACKNLGVTHITNGCYRLHPIEWGIGEAAGALAAFAARTGKLPRQVRADAVALADFQKRLTTGGVKIAWPATATN